MRLLLVNPATRMDAKTIARKPDSLPIGLAIINGCLKTAGHEVEVLDIHALGLDQGAVLRKLRQLAGVEVQGIGITGMSTQYAYIKWLVATLREVFGHQIRIVVGGAIAIFSHEVLMRHSAVDACVLGEGERIAASIFEATDLATVPGIAWRDASEIRVNAQTDCDCALDTLPWPDYAGFPMNAYKECMRFNLRIPQTGRTENIRYFNLLAGRGCPYKCRFCSRQFSGFRLRSAQDVVAEILHQKRRYDFNTVMFSDELVASSENRVYEICTALAPANLWWSCNARSNLLTRNMLRLMKAAGCYQVSLGIESGSQRILDAMGKKTTVAKARRAILLGLEAGLHVNVQLIFGYPGESDETVAETVEFFKGLPINVGFAILTPLPGSSLYEEVKNSGRIPDEDAYLSSLEAGFTKLRLNLTNWSDEEFMAIRTGITTTINKRAPRVRGKRWRYEIPDSQARPSMFVACYPMPTAYESMPHGIERSLRELTPKGRLLTDSHAIYRQALQKNIPIEFLYHLVDGTFEKESYREVDAYEKAEKFVDFCLAYISGDPKATVFSFLLARYLRYDMIRKVRPLLWLQTYYAMMTRARPEEPLVFVSDNPGVDSESVDFAVTGAVNLSPSQTLRRKLFSFLKDVYVTANALPFGESSDHGKETGISLSSADSGQEVDGRRVGPLAFVVIDPGSGVCIKPLLPILRLLQGQGEGGTMRIYAGNDFTGDSLRNAGHEAIAVGRSGRFQSCGDRRAVYEAIGATKHRLQTLARRFPKGSLEQAMTKRLLDMPLLDMARCASSYKYFLDAFSRERPQAVAIFPQLSYVGYAASLACKTLGIASMMFYHARVSEHPYYAALHTDFIGCYGLQCRDALLGLGIPKEQLIIVGNPSYDNIHALDHGTARLAVCQQFSLPETARFILVCTQLMERVGTRDWITRLIEINEREMSPEWHLLIKPHPDESEAEYTQLMSAGMVKTSILSSSADLTLLLSSAEVVITGGSSTGMEAAFFGKPVIVVDIDSHDAGALYVKEGIAVRVTTLDGLGPALLTVTEDNKVRGELAAKREAFVERYAYRLDGKAAARFVAALRSLAPPK